MKVIRPVVTAVTLAGALALGLSAAVSASAATAPAASHRAPAITISNGPLPVCPTRPTQPCPFP